MILDHELMKSTDKKIKVSMSFHLERRLIVFHACSVVYTHIHTSWLLKFSNKKDFSFPLHLLSHSDDSRNKEFFTQSGGEFSFAQQRTFYSKEIQTRS